METNTEQRRGGRDQRTIILTEQFPVRIIEE